jgi:hypothetical protein
MEICRDDMSLWLLRAKKKPMESWAFGYIQSKKFVLNFRCFCHKMGHTIDKICRIC